ncbi:MAG: TIM barrel protein [Bryobacterales bacterium]|nr:TIM barrel protein [Bryobacterales bacterium]
MKPLTAWIIPALIAAMLCGAAETVASVFARGNLVAWCIVPFDARKRGPEERAAMLKKLGLRKFVYDWREKDIPDFDREIDALKKHGIHLQGFWTPHPASPAQSGKLPVILDLLKRRKLRTELWLSISQDKAFLAMPDEQKLETASAIVKKVAIEAQALDCKVGLYNHGGWYGEPENQIRVIERVGMKNVGIVYNFHHAHEHIARFPELLTKMRPHLLAINLNGMSAEAKILPVGDGKHELEMLRAIQRSGYQGPIGILGHREEMDAEESLRLNVTGLKRLLPSLGEEAAAKTY